MPWSVEKALSARPPALPEKQRRIGSSEVLWFESEPGVAVILSEGGTVDDRFLAYVVTRDELAACGIRNAKFSFDNLTNGDPIHPGLDNYWTGQQVPGWSPGTFGKGVISEDGEVYHWGTGADADGAPWHDSGITHLGLNSTRASRFRLNPDGSWTRYSRPQPHEDEMEHYVSQIPGVRNEVPYGTEFDSQALWSDLDAFDSKFARQHISKTSNWNDIMAKAKRLVQSGNITLLRNGYNIIVAHVIGDHGEYTCEISRDDPNSRAITQWTCECPWDQFAFQRTRQWKKYEGRPCAHVLAAYWLSQGTPLDEDKPPGQEQRGPGGPGAPTGGPLMTPEPFQPRLPVPGQPGPDGGMMPPLPPATQNQFGAPPPSAGPYPPEAQQPMQMFQPPMDNNIIPPYPMDPATYQQPVSVPGGRPGPYPANPLQQPGTLSAKIPSLDKLMPYKDTQECYLVAEGIAKKWPSLQQDAGFYDHPTRGPGDHAWNVAPDGTIVDMTATQFGRQPHIVLPDDPKHRRYVSWERQEQQAQTIAHDKGWHEGHDANPGVCPKCSTLAKVVAGKGDEFAPGSTARMEEGTYGQTEGREGAIDAGQWVEIPQNAMVEVVYQDPSTGWVEVLYPLKGGAMTSYHARCFVEPDKLTPFPGKDSPMGPRRRI